MNQSDMTPEQLEAFKGYSMVVWGLALLWLLYLLRRGKK